MARDYDYLFKLLIIGDSGKETPGMRNGNRPQLAYNDIYIHYIDLARAFCAGYTPNADFE